MSSIEPTFKLFDDIAGRELTADNSANPVSSNGAIAILVATEKRFGIYKV